MIARNVECKKCGEELNSCEVRGSQESKYSINEIRHEKVEKLGGEFDTLVCAMWAEVSKPTNSMHMEKIAGMKKNEAIIFHSNKKKSYLNFVTGEQNSRAEMWIYNATARQDDDCNYDDGDDNDQNDTYA